MDQTPEEVLKVIDKALEEARVAKAEVVAAKAELAILKGKITGEEAEKSKAVILAVTTAGRS